MISPLHIFLAEDDEDDRLLFNDVLQELSTRVELTIANNGERLMDLLSQQDLPDVLFLDLNMPLKNGFECLSEIKQNDRMKELPVIIFSTTSQPSTIEQVYQRGAQMYVRKPSDFGKLKKIIGHILSVNWKKNQPQPQKDEFVLSV